MFVNKGGESCRDRTFIGTVCAVCEEPLEHTLRGEHILQLSCTHVSHEACFYEFIKEFHAQRCPTCDAPLGLNPSRGCAIDFEVLNRVMRSAPPALEPSRDDQLTPTPWDPNPSSSAAAHQPQAHAGATSPTQPPSRPTRENSLSDPSRAPSAYRYHYPQTVHGRTPSNDTGFGSASEYEQRRHDYDSRRHDYDGDSIAATSVTNTRINPRNPIPAPIVTVRSEFPTLSKSRHPQSLTCLVTVEVVDGKWRPHPDDFQQHAAVPSTIYEEGHGPPKARSQPRDRRGRSVSDLRSSPMEETKEELYDRCENWHGLDFERFGRRLLHGTVRVGKDRETWQELECHLFTEMLICVKAKKVPSPPQWEGAAERPQKLPKVSLKGSILIKKHLQQVQIVPGSDILTLTLSATELPQFHLHFRERSQLETWRQALLSINRPEPSSEDEYDLDLSGTDEDDGAPPSKTGRCRGSSVRSSSYGGNRSQATAPTEYTNSRAGVQDIRLGTSSIHVPLDVVVVVPVSSSMAGLKVNVLRDALRFLVTSLGERDRMGLVTFGSGGGCVPLVSLTTKSWSGWNRMIESIRPLGQRSLGADVVVGANVAMDLLMQRRSSNPLSSILLINDSSSTDHDSVDFVVSRAEAAKVAIHSFGLGLAHKPDTLVELSTRTKALYTYVKDWMMLRECLAGCMGALQSTSHQNVKLKLRLPEGSPAKFVKVSGATHVTKRATGRDAEASLGDLRFGDKRDVLVQLAIVGDSSTSDSPLSDPWESMISGLEALSGTWDHDDPRSLSVEELPLLQADLQWGNILREGHIAQLPRPSLLAITMLPCTTKKTPPPGHSPTPPIPPHPSVVQRRMELLTSDMLSRALTLVGRNQNDRAQHLLGETRSILKGLGPRGSAGRAPPPPPPSGALPPTPKGPPSEANSRSASQHGHRPPSPHRHCHPSPFTPTVDPTITAALDAELDASLEWISNPAHFARDSRKAILQAIGVISSQRAYTFRTAVESLWAARIGGIMRLSERNQDWREASDARLLEES